MKKKMAILIIIITLMAVFFYSQNNWLVTTRVEPAFDRLPEEFDGFRIVQLSDLHNKSFGSGQQRLLRILDKSEPDILVITGDLVDSKHYDPLPALELVRGAVKIAPVYYVTGNHEWWSGKFDNLEVRLREAGAVVLRNEWKAIEAQGRKIYIAGVDDPFSANNNGDETGYMSDRLRDIAASIPRDGFKILLSHRPEQFLLYSSLGFDLVFSGHAHGGQFRLPFLGGLVAPDQGFLPKYTSGVHQDQSTVMIISRGLGNSIIPQRVFNRPEVIEAVLRSKALIKNTMP